MALIAHRRDWDRLLANLPAADQTAMAAARARQAHLTKPAGSLGRLEDLAIWLAGWQGTERPTIRAPHVAIFAGNHGVCAQGVSAFPSAVTAQMVANFAGGGAAINALAANAGASLSVHPLADLAPTGDITAGPALTEAECLAAMNMGATAIPEGCDLLALGEMGIGNTTIAAALCAAMFGGSGHDWAGRGTGVDDPTLFHKGAVIDRALARVGSARSLSGVEILCQLGGHELAAIAGAIVAARLKRIPVLLDGFVVTAAAATLARPAHDALAHCLAAHCSAEKAHRRLLEALALAVEPLLDMGMRLGEGSGAALAIPIVRAAAATHCQMATFSEAAVSGRSVGETLP